MKEEMDNEQLEILLCSANSSTDVGDYKFVVASIHATMVFFSQWGFETRYDGKGRDWLM